MTFANFRVKLNDYYILALSDLPSISKAPVLVMVTESIPQSDGYLTSI